MLAALPQAPAARAALAEPAGAEDVVRVAWETVNGNFFDPTFGGVDWAALRPAYLAKAAARGADGYAVAREMVARLGDPATYVLTAQERADLEKSRGRVDLVGVGILLGVTRDGRVVVRDVLPGGPAGRSGLRRGEVVLRVDGKPAQDMSLDETASRIRGERGTRVRLDVAEPGGGTRQLVLTREPVSFTPQVEGRVLPGNVGYLHATHFAPGAETAFLAQLRKLSRTQALVLDLRQSLGGGTLSTLLQVTALLTADPLGVLMSRGGMVPLVPQVAKSSANPLVPAPTPLDGYSRPVAVLVDETTTFEMLAFALRENGRALLVGRPTSPSAGDTQQTFDLPGGGAVVVTTSRFFSARGRPLAGPVVPDVVIPFDDGFLKAWAQGRDPDVDRAVEALKQRSLL